MAKRLNELEESLAEAQQALSSSRDAATRLKEFASCLFLGL